MKALWLAAASVLLAVGCAPADGGVDQATRAIVYGADHRLEHFQLDDPAAKARVGRSVVALVRKSSIRRTLEGLTLNARSWSEQDQLCEGEPFGEQTAAAFCSGILVDWDLVLTAGHCTRVLVPSAFVAVFGYYFSAPGKLAIGDEDIIDVAQVITATESQPDRRPRLDHAWLRLARPAQPPREPAPIRTALAGLRAGAPILFAGTSGGVPLKADRGATVANLGEPWGDYFVANTDSAQGASGGGAFDGELALLGALERGGADFVRTDSGCWTTSRRPDDEPQEEFTFAARALENLCRTAPHATSLCRRDCGDPCSALPPAGAGCTLAPPGGRGRSTPAFVLLLAGAFLLAMGGRARRKRPIRPVDTVPVAPAPWRALRAAPGRGQLFGRRAVGSLLVALLPLVAWPAAGRAQPASAGPTTILLVRHAEKAGPAGDVPLNAAGKRRAIRLATMLRDAEVRYVYTTDLIRTRETAAPLVAKIGVSPQVVAAGAIDALVAKLRALPGGTTALVVHHSNTLPEIVEKLGGGKVPPLADEEFDRLLVLTRWPGGVRVTTLRY